MSLLNKKRLSLSYIFNINSREFEIYVLIINYTTNQKKAEKFMHLKTFV